MITDDLDYDKAIETREVFIAVPGIIKAISTDKENLFDVEELLNSIDITKKTRLLCAIDIHFPIISGKIVEHILKNLNRYKKITFDELVNLVYESLEYTIEIPSSDSYIGFRARALEHTGSRIISILLSDFLV